jgi:antitoxin component of RelBE/YafQ-DinJ toxin-antitoxin module
MTPRKANPIEANPVLNWRVPPEIMRQLDELCKSYGMNRSQVLMMLVTKEYTTQTKSPA